MKMELNAGGKAIVIEGEFSVEVRDLPVQAAEPARPVAVPSAPPVPAPALSLVPPPASVPLPPDSCTLPPESCALFPRLVEARRRLAAEQNVPPYVIFHDKTLREMADARPADLAAFGQISGVGQAKLEKYGAAFLAVIQGGEAV